MFNISSKQKTQGQMTALPHQPVLTYSLKCKDLEDTVTTKLPINGTRESDERLSEPENYRDLEGIRMTRGGSLDTVRDKGGHHNKADTEKGGHRNKHRGTLTSN